MAKISYKSKINFNLYYRKYPNLVRTKKIIIFKGAHHNYDQKNYYQKKCKLN